MIIVSLLRETCCFEKCFRTLFCFEQQKTSKTLRSNCTQVRWRKKKKQRRQVYITWDLKNAYKLAKILEQSSSTRQVSVYRSFFFSDHCMYKTKFNGFHVAVGLCSNRSQRTSKCGKNISDTLACGSCATSFLPQSFWCHLWSITEQIQGNPSTCR